MGRMSEQAAYEADMRAFDTDEAWEQEVAEQEAHRLADALRRMAKHESDVEDHQLIISACGMSSIVKLDGVVG